MPLPESIRVKLSSEQVGTIAMTPVVVQEMPLRDLLDLMLAVAGRDAARIRDLLLRGTLVSGASRYRWERMVAEVEAIEEILASFPGPDASREFNPSACHKVVLRGHRVQIDIPREAAEERGFLRRRSYWDAVLAAAAAGTPSYVDYSYKEKADRYHVRLDSSGSEVLRAEARLLRYPTLATQVRSGGFELIELYTRR